MSETIPITAAAQLSDVDDSVLHTANAGLVVYRTAQIAGGRASAARQASRAALEDFNAKHVGMATACAYEEMFGVRGRLHWLIHVRSLADYPGAPQFDPDDDLFVPGTVQDTVMQPHRWGMHGTLTEAMVESIGNDPASGPNVAGPDGPLFVVTPASAQTAQQPNEILHSINSGMILRRTADFDYSFRDEARVFARTIAENVNIAAAGQASAFLYEEDFGRMDRVHWFIHLRSVGVYRLLMGLDARTDPDAPRASYLRDWIDLDKGGGSWDRMLVQGSVRDLALLPSRWPA